MKAIIAGGGIGGLSAALCLHKFGWDVEILEQAAELGEVGAGIQISPNGMKVLQALDLDAEIENAGFRPRASQLRMGQSGRVIMTNNMVDYEDRYGAPYLHIHRADLINTLKSVVDERLPSAIHTGKSVTGYGQNENRAWLTLDDGTIVEGDIVIGADGIKSVMRNQMIGADEPHFTGNVAWRAVVPVEKLGRNVPLPVACVWLGEGKHAVTYLLRGGRLANFVGVVERDDWQEESWTQQGSREEALADFSDWHPTITTMIEQAESHFRWALFDRKPLDNWTDGRAILLGDACHPMLPFMAQGAVQAIEDGYVLARFLSEQTTIEGAFAGYFAARHKRTAKIQAAARANMKIFHQPDALGPIWLASKLRPNALDDRMDWVYSHDVTA